MREKFLTNVINIIYIYNFGVLFIEFLFQLSSRIMLQVIFCIFAEIIHQFCNHIAQNLNILVINFLEQVI